MTENTIKKIDSSQGKDNVEALVEENEDINRNTSTEDKDSSSSIAEDSTNKDMHVHVFTHTAYA